MARPSNTIPFPARVVPDPGPQGVIAPHLEGSAQTPRLDVQAAMAPAQGVAKIGQGLEQAGTALGQLSGKIAEADTTTAEYSQALLMQQARADITTATTQEPDRNKWGGIADARLGQLATDVSKLPNVPASAKKLLDYKMASFGIDIRGGLQVHAAEKSISDARTVIDAVVKHAGAIDDVPLGVKTILDGEKRGYYPHEVAVAKIDDLNAHAEVTRNQNTLDANYRAIDADPYAWKEANKKMPEGMKAQLWDRLNTQADQTIRVKQGQSVENFDAELEAGAQPNSTTGIQNEQDLKEWFEKSPDAQHLTAKERLGFETHFKTFKNQEKRQDYENNAPTYASKLYSQIQNIDPKKTTVEEYQAIRQTIGFLPINMRAPLNKMAGDKWEGKTSPPDKSIVSAGEEILKSKMRNGDFGVYDEPQFYENSTTHEMKPDISPETGKQRKVRNEAKYQDALVKKSIVGGQYKQWLIDNKDIQAGIERGDEASIKKANVKLNQLVGLAPLARTVDAIADLFKPLAINPTQAPPTKPDQPSAAPDAKAAPRGEHHFLFEEKKKDAVLEQPPDMSSNAGKNPDGRSSNKEAPLDQNDLPDKSENEGPPLSPLLPDATPTEEKQSGGDGSSRSDPGVPTRVITDAEIKKAGKELQVIDPDTGEWKQIGRDEFRKKKWLVPEGK